MAHICNEPGYTTNIRAERLLNAAILGANIREGFEEYLSILDAFYADDVEASCEGCEATITGKPALRSRLMAFVAPLHVFAEVGGLSASIRAESIASDTSDEMHSRWTLAMTGKPGRRFVLRWRAQRKWREGRVVYEHHSEIEETGGPLTEADLRRFHANLVAEN